MSSRTAAASRAIREAWENEKRLVLEGKGTRDWTDEHQKQIKERGKAYDDRGLAFEGQHMKSVSAYPEYQDDPRNIQLLSREEHLAAHGGSWTNQTNGYYDPVLKTMSHFGHGPPHPCPEAPLTNPLYAEPLNAASTQATSANLKHGTASSHVAATPKGNLRQWTQSLQRFAKQAWSNPQLRAALLAAGPVVAKVSMDVALDRSARGDRTAVSSAQPSTKMAPGPATDSGHQVRQSPDEHGVSGYTRKDGTNVRPHRRGGMKD